jgi:ABC-type lipopolysaccharide export system ATPase subunit
MPGAWSFNIVAVRPGLQVQQLRHVTGQPLSSQQQARIAVGQTLADWPTVGVLLREPGTSKHPQALVQEFTAA